jgi:DNA-directed RNA polymerase subunit RPC12/RpoP
MTAMYKCVHCDWEGMTPAITDTSVMVDDDRPSQGTWHRVQCPTCFHDVHVKSFTVDKSNASETAHIT